MIFMGRGNPYTHYRDFYTLRPRLCIHTSFLFLFPATPLFLFLLGRLRSDRDGLVLVRRVLLREHLQLLIRIRTDALCCLIVIDASVGNCIKGVPATRSMARQSIGSRTAYKEETPVPSGTPEASCCHAPPARG